MAGCETAPPAPAELVPGLVSPYAPAPFAVGIKVVANNAALLAGKGSVAFKLPHVRSLLVRTSIAQIPEALLWMTIELHTPDGALYSQRHLPFSADPGITEIDSPDGIDRRVEVDRIKTIEGGYALDTAIPVGGTALTRTADPGAWRLNVRIDGQPTLSFEQTLDFGMAL